MSTILSQKSSSGYSSSEESEKQHFDTFARSYDNNYNYHQPFTVYKIIKKSKEFASQLSVLPPNARKNILEIGCGTGEYTRQISQLLPNSHITALDISPAILRIATQKCKKNCPNVKFQAGSAYHTSYPSNYFDVIYGFYVLHHLDAKLLNKELARILKPGGIVFFYEPNILNPIVFAIKSNPYLKQLVNDSPAEWAINPLVISHSFTNFKTTKIYLTEFVFPFNNLNLSLLIFIDHFTNLFRHLPVIKYLGGSVQLWLKKF